MEHAMVKYAKLFERKAQAGAKPCRPTTPYRTPHASHAPHAPHAPHALHVPHAPHASPDARHASTYSYASWRESLTSNTDLDATDYEE